MASKKRRINIAIDMTPMVDIAFLLLIFYMTTTSFKPPEKFQVILPMSESRYNVPVADLINITVNKDDEIFFEYIISEVPENDTVLNGVHVSAGDTTVVRDYIEVEPRTLNAEFIKVQAKFLRKGTNPPLIVKADQHCRYGTIKKIMDALQDLNINQFSLMTDRDRGGVVAQESAEPAG
jgi:biopolymer transport protein ExbD